LRGEVFGVLGELLHIGSHDPSSGLIKLTQVVNMLGWYVAKRDADPTDIKAIEPRLQDRLRSVADAGHPVIKAVFVFVAADKNDGAVSNPLSVLGLLGVWGHELELSGLAHGEHDDRARLRVSVHTQTGVINRGLTPVLGLTAIVVDEAGVRQRTVVSVKRELVSQALEDAHHDGGNRLRRHALLMLVIGLRIVAKGGELPGAEPIDRPRETAAIAAAARGVGPIALLPQGTQAGEVTTELFGLRRAHESR
jgi:hypothetical protein